jgi:hypothetical protein
VGGPPANCNDGNDCTADSCVSPTGCQHAPVPGCVCNVDADCADTDQCTTNEHCVGHACFSDPVNCDDGKVCTDDSCNPATGCAHVNNNAPCNDGSACSTNDTCQGGICVGGPAPNCNDNNVCTDDGCDTGTGCTHSNNTAPCDDGSFCTTNDACAGSVCVGGPAPSCDDNNVCTNDSCIPASGCTHPAGNAGTICRPCASIPCDCDVAETCTGTSPACPADGYAASSVQCRPAVGECDVAENCTGSGPNCPENAFQPNGTICTSDGLFCDGVESCQAGTCVSPGAACPSGQSCDEASSTCFQGGCPDTAVACRIAQKALLLIKDRTDNTQDKLIWKWVKGESTTPAEFGDPTTNANYALCFYDGPSMGLIGQSNVPFGVFWSAAGSKGYKYKDITGAADGIQQIRVKGSTTNKSKAMVKGAGAGLPDLTLPIPMGDLPLVVQLRDNHSGVCWEGSFAKPKRNQIGQFKAKTSMPLP